MIVLIALGGNAMTAPDGRATPADQIAALGRAAGRIAQVAATGAEVLVTHGNGPQVGNLLVKNELAAAVVPPVPLDWCGAQTQGTIGFVLCNALERALAGRRPVAALVTRTVVDAADPGFRTPSKPIGAVTATQLRRYAADGQFASGDMGPKVEAACRFVEAGGERAVITSLDRIADAVAGGTGTVVTRR